MTFILNVLWFQTSWFPYDSYISMLEHCIPWYIFLHTSLVFGIILHVYNCICGWTSNLHWHVYIGRIDMFLFCMIEMDRKLDFFFLCNTVWVSSPIWTQYWWWGKKHYTYELLIFFICNSALEHVIIIFLSSPCYSKLLLELLILLVGLGVWIFDLSNFFYFCFFIFFF